jgi:putative oxygen-independent coproporphyrinogen III oxidase
VRGLYIHVPFCPVVCSYCDFAVMKAPKRLHIRWYESVIQELKLRSSINDSFDTLYLGGGTPSVLDVAMVDQLLHQVNALVDISDLKEFTIEVNPENVTEEYIESLKAVGVTRISIGVQSFNESLLKRLGRPHSVEKAVCALNILKKSKLPFSLDLMFGLPGQTVPDFLESLQQALTFNPSHISFYGLTVEAHTKFDQDFSKGKLHIPEDLYNEMYQKGVQLVEEHGIFRYEVSNFAKPGLESMHNSLYWNHSEYLGIGPGAHSFLAQQRSCGPRKFRQWERWVESGAKTDLMECEPIDDTTLINEQLWLQLRQQKGVDSSALKKESQIAAVKKWVQLGCIIHENGSIRLDGDGWVYLDEITTDLMV